MTAPGLRWSWICTHFLNGQPKSASLAASLRKFLDRDDDHCGDDDNGNRNDPLGDRGDHHDRLNPVDEVFQVFVRTGRSRT